MITINLRKNRKERAPIGSQPGVIADVYCSKGRNSKGDEMDYLNVVIQLVSRDRSGQRFQLSKAYLISERRIDAVAKEMEKGLGRKLTDSELESFDAEALLLNKPVVVDVAHRKTDGKDIAAIAAFAPSNDTTITVSADFTRKNGTAVSTQ